MNTLNIKLLSDNATLPTRSTPTDSGLDLYASEDVTVKAGKTLIIPTDIAIELPLGYEAQVNGYGKRLAYVKEIKGLS